MPDAGEMELLRASRDAGVLVRIVVTRCQYNCCGRGWRLKAGYEQVYTGRVTMLDDEQFRLMNSGLGTVSYSIEARLEHVELVDVP